MASSKPFQLSGSSALFNLAHAQSDRPFAFTHPRGLINIPTPCSIPAPCGRSCELPLGPERHASIGLGHLARLVIVGVSRGQGTFCQQAVELFTQVGCILRAQPAAKTATTLTVFLRDEADEADCRKILQAIFGQERPIATFVAQPPCCGAALGVEVWAAGGRGVRILRHGPDSLSVESDGIRWVHCGGVRGHAVPDAPYGETLSALENMRSQLALAGVEFDQVVRTWLYINQITEGPEGRQRYQELNRARTDFFGNFRFGRQARAPWAPPTIYPASTGIGTQGRSMSMAAMALQSERPDVFIMPLENPRQTPAYDYQALYSPQSPKFSRAMAVVQGNFVTTLVSGTASIVNARSRHHNDIARQTQQTLENIAHLVAPENFARHGLPGGGASLGDIAKIRVYMKRPEDYEPCRAICEQALPGVPAIYLQADVCRPDLLVEIEAVAFSPFAGASQLHLSSRPGIGNLRQPGPGL